MNHARLKTGAARRPIAMRGRYAERPDGDARALCRTAGIEAALLRHESGQAKQSVDVRRLDADAIADLVNGGNERVELERPAGDGILQHRCLEAAELARQAHTLFARLRDRAAD